MHSKRLFALITVICIIFIGCSKTESEQLKQEILQNNIDACVSGGLYSLKFCKCAMQVAYDSLEKDGKPYYQTLLQALKDPPQGNMQKINAVLRAKAYINAKYQFFYNISPLNKKCKD